MSFFIAPAASFISFGFFEEGEWLSNLRGTCCARTAIYLWYAVGIFAYKLTFGFRACGFMAFPVTFWFFADRFTFGLRGLAVSNAMGLFADSDALGAVEHFTSLIWAFNFTFGFFAFNVTDCVFGFGTAGVALGGFANWVANSGAMWVVTFP